MFTDKDYRRRLIDDKIDIHLKLFGAVDIMDVRECGKTWTAKNHSKSAVYLDDSAENFDNRAKAKMDVSLILGDEYPQLIDEWGEVPEIWDAVVKDPETGIYIIPITALKN